MAEASYTTTGLGAGELPDTEPAELTHNEAHCEEALSHLLHQFSQATRLRDLVCVLAEQGQEVEDALWQLYTERTLDESEGDQLDGIGAIVGEDRKGRTDATYRMFIAAKILVNLSDGKAEQLYSILDAILPDGQFQITDHQPAAITVSILTDIGAVDPFEVLYFLRSAKAAGVKLDFVWTYSDSQLTFTFGDSADYPEGDNLQGFGSTTDASWGGDLASVGS